MATSAMSEEERLSTSASRNASWVRELPSADRASSDRQTSATVGSVSKTSPITVIAISVNRNGPVEAGGLRVDGG